MNEKNRKLFVRVLCLVLVGVMCLGLIAVAVSG